MTEESSNQPQNQEPMGQGAMTPESSCPSSQIITNGFALASLILGIFGAITFTGMGGAILGPIAVIFGIIAIKQIRKNPQQFHGSGLAIAGIIIGGLSFLVITIVLLSMFLDARQRTRQSSCLMNIKRLSLAMQMYAQDNNNQLPTAANWNDKLLPYSYSYKRTVLNCPSVKPAQPSYGMNRQLSDLPVTKIKSPADTVSIFESAPGKNQSGDMENLVSPSRHNGGDSFGFVDGHCKWLSERSIGELNWDPNIVPQSVPMPYDTH